MEIINSIDNNYNRIDKDSFKSHLAIGLRIIVTIN